ncbi:hypothetical protein AK812_SmicGene9924 [Symbiodinium microadriaticum]|uniref:Uncharacterized protein n=1 Tax=Symbiodinium microadriaticum TaxID=2951 RepID=A0A1Q9EH53_SYMMI|nr:hypothetical protein AK812_SmicGene9924 [Symbiodinium microadriaticum]
MLQSTRHVGEYTNLVMFNAAATAAAAGADWRGATIRLMDLQIPADIISYNASGRELYNSLRRCAAMGAVLPGSRGSGFSRDRPGSSLDLPLNADLAGANAAASGCGRGGCWQLTRLLLELLATKRCQPDQISDPAVKGPPREHFCLRAQRAVAAGRPLTMKVSSLSMVAVPLREGLSEALRLHARQRQDGRELASGAGTPRSDGGPPSLTFEKRGSLEVKVESLWLWPAGGHDATLILGAVMSTTAQAGLGDGIDSEGFAVAADHGTPGRGRN